MIERRGYLQSFVVECNGCLDNHETDHDDFTNAVASIKQEGWYITQRQGEWRHFCPACVKEGNTA